MPNPQPTSGTNTALLIFARQPHVEARFKRFAPGKGYRQNLQVATALLEHTLEVAHSSGLPVIWLNEKAQHGNGFGERLANAMEAIWAMGYERQIVIGSDTPGLTAETIVDAGEIIESQDWALGASTDGGTYLIAIQRSVYDRDTILSQPWLSGQALESLTNALESSLGKGSVLPELSDLDDAHDLSQVIESAEAGAFLTKTLRNILLTWQKKAPSFIDSLFTVYAGLHHGLRAPPLA